MLPASASVRRHNATPPLATIHPTPHAPSAAPRITRRPPPAAPPARTQAYPRMNEGMPMLGGEAARLLAVLGAASRASNGPGDMRA